MGAIVQTIWKFPLVLNDVFRLPMPADAKILKVGFQDGELYAWAQLEAPQGGAIASGADIIDITTQTAPYRVFHVYVTGHRIPNPDLLTYIDTVFQGAYVWHVFERKQ